MSDEELTIKQKLDQYMNQGFNSEQLNEIRIGLEDELDVSFYARRDMPASEMMYIRKELYKNHLLEKTREESALKLQKEKAEEKTAIKQLDEIKKRRELAIISLVIFAISVIGTILYIV